MTHKMNLYSEPFEMIRNGQKTIELRLNDEKRQMSEIVNRIVADRIENHHKQKEK